MGRYNINIILTTINRLALTFTLHSQIQPTAMIMGLIHMIGHSFTLPPELEDSP